MEIKKININEIDLVTELFNKYRIFYNQPSDINVARGFLHRRLRNNESVILVAVIKHHDETVAGGFIHIYPKYEEDKNEKGWIINDLFVDQEFRKRYIAESLVKTAIFFAKNDGAKFIEVSTGVDDTTAQKFYERSEHIKQIFHTDPFVYKFELY